MKKKKNSIDKYLDIIQKLELKHSINGPLERIEDIGLYINFFLGEQTEKTLKSYANIINLILKKIDNSDSNLAKIKLLCAFLQKSEIKNIFIAKSNNTVNIPLIYNNINATIYQLTINLKNNKVIELCFIEEFFDKRLNMFFTLLSQKIKETFKKEYMSIHDKIRSIVVTSSNTMLDFTIPSYNGTSIGCFTNYDHNITQFDRIVDFEIIMYQIIRDFYDENSELIDSIKDEKDITVINFTNNKSIIIKDENFRDRITPFIDNVIDDLIDVKIKKKGRNLQ